MRIVTPASDSDDINELRSDSGIEESERADFTDLSSMLTMTAGADAVDSGIEDNERADVKDLSSMVEYFELGPSLEFIKTAGAETDDLNGAVFNSAAFSIGRSNRRAVKGLESDVGEDDPLSAG